MLVTDWGRKKMCNILGGRLYGKKALGKCVDGRLTFRLASQKVISPI